MKLTLIAPGLDVRSGMTANVTFDGTADAAADHAITLPATALFHRGETPAVWVVRKGTDTLELRPVSIGRYDERTVSITSGPSGERVVMQGVHTVSAGERVRAVPPLHPEEFPSRTPPNVNIRRTARTIREPMPARATTVASICPRGRSSISNW